MSDTKSTMEQFFTRQKANDGVTLPLSLPGGEKTPYSLTIRGVDSDVFRAAEADENRKLSELANEPPDPKKLLAFHNDSRLRLLASLIAGWSLPDEFTPENVMMFLREAPQVADSINQAAHRSRFFKLGLTNSTPSPAPNLS